MVVKGWPADYAGLWPVTLEGALERGESPGENMQVYVDGLAQARDMSNPTVRQIIEDYGRYWILLEQDWRSAAALGETEAPATGPAAELLQRLQEQCAAYPDYY